MQISQNATPAHDASMEVVDQGIGQVLHGRDRADRENPSQSAPADASLLALAAGGYHSAGDPWRVWPVRHAAG
jgi:hypothetical protein